MPKGDGSVFIHTFLWGCWLRFFCTRSYRIRIIFKRSIWSMNGILAGTTSLSHSGLGSDSYERVKRTLQPKPHRQMQFSVIPRTQGELFENYWIRIRKTMTVWTNYYYNYTELLILDRNTWNHITVCKLFVLIIVNWRSNRLQRIIIS